MVSDGHERFDGTRQILDPGESIASVKRAAIDADIEEMVSFGINETDETGPLHPQKKAGRRAGMKSEKAPSILAHKSDQRYVFRLVTSVDSLMESLFSRPI